MGQVATYLLTWNAFEKEMVCKRQGLLKVPVSTWEIRMTEEERQNILDAIFETLLSEDHQYVGSVYGNLSSSEPGIWVEINRSKSFFGTSVKSAIFTARQADWWYLIRDGNLIKDDYERFELRVNLGEKWKESEPNMMRGESRTRIALNIQMVTDIPEHELDYLTSQVSSLQNPEPSVDDWDDEPLKQFEFLRVKGWEGLWFLDENKTVFRKIRLSGSHEGYRVHMGEFCENDRGREYNIVARLTFDDGVLLLSISCQTLTNALVETNCKYKR